MCIRDRLFNSYLVIFRPPFTQIMYYLECYTSLVSEDPLTMYLQLVAFMCVAYCLVALFVMGVFLRKRLPNFWSNFLTACIVILQNLLPSIISAMMFAQQCDTTLQKDHKISFMTVDARYECGTPKHNSLKSFAIATLVIYFAIVLSFLLLLILFRKRLAEPQFRLSLGYLYNDYRPESYYWEFLRIFQKAILIFLAVYFKKDYQNKTLTMTIFLWIYYGLVSNVKPFANESFNNIDRRVTVIYISTLFLSFYIRDNRVVWLRTPATTIMWTMNMIYVISMAYLLMKTYKEVFGQKVYGCLAWIGNRIYRIFKS
eukprot:TRINITY_DN18566_c0_g1_i1.p1 TRINITY_DN18566_c0_g1~~TRINITY_DN18566_c0_g1_i1.p1  ORF type:complete len:333 (-),score=57.71 TRINITY_DN18566_c0_g1_i1:115-1056(-)